MISFRWLGRGDIAASPEKDCEYMGKLCRVTNKISPGIVVMSYGVIEENGIKPSWKAKH